MATYPASIVTFLTKTNKVDLVDAAHINDLQNEVLAIQQELGKDPAGSAVDVKTRLYVSIDNDGAVRKGTAFPSSPIAGQPFYRTDTKVLYVYDGSSWSISAGTSFRAYYSGQINIQSLGGKKIVGFSETFDTGGYFASDRFTPGVAGKYIIGFICGRLSGAYWSDSEGKICIYKNGSLYSIIGGSNYGTSYGAGEGPLNGSDIIDMNGTTDYVEIYLEDDSDSNVGYIDNPVFWGVLT